MSIFDFVDYKAYFNSYVESLPKNGRGEYRRVAERLNVSSTMISQIFHGDKHLSLELASELGDYLNLNELETDYLFLMLECARAGSFRLQQKLKRRLENAQAEAKRLQVRVQPDKELDDSQKAIFYSSWLYSGIRLLTDVPELKNVQAIADRLHLPRNLVQKVVDFLITEKLVIQENGELKLGSRKTYVGSDSPFVPKHHQNWRLQGMQKMALSDPEHFFYTGPMCLSKETAAEVRAELTNAVERIYKMVIPSPSETVRCLNIDWFEY